MALDPALRPHRRYNPLAREWILVSPHRALRPWQGQVESAPVERRPEYDPQCYLCPGNARARPSGGSEAPRNPHYTATYVFRNDFSALLPDGDGCEVGAGTLLRARAERGVCRVVVFSPRHDLTLAEMAAADVRAVVDTWAEEHAALGALPNVNHVQIFENKGKIMGCSNPHPHGQIWSGDALPVEAEREDAEQERHLASTGRRLVADYAEAEQGGPRVISDADGWLTLVPFWAAWPFEAMLVPLTPAARLADLGDAARDGLATALRDLNLRYDALFRRPFPFSMGWHQAPFGGAPTDHWQVHAHFYPPLLRATVRKFMVGYELLSEPQRDLTPEEAAERLRDALG